MILRSLNITGFGRLVDRHFAFGAGLNVVYGLNESGKSTLVNAIVATLYGPDRKKELWRPWSGAPFITTLRYELANGEPIEVQRDFDRDAKGLHVYDRNGNDASAQLSGHKLVPGEAHLGVPLDVFLNAACVRQQAMAIDCGKDSAPIATHLARALDGGPREDAALGAIARLDEALRLHVGTGRARKNAPLRTCRAQAEAQHRKLAQAHEQLEALDDLRERFEGAVRERERLTGSASELDRRLRSLRAGAIADQLSSLRQFRTELAELQADYARYDDVATFAAERESEIDAAFFAWQAAHQVSSAAQAEADAAQLSEPERVELERRQRDAGSIDGSTFNTLTAAKARADAARQTAAAARREAAAARGADTGSNARSVILFAGALALCVATGFAIAHSWTWTGVATAIALAALTSAFARRRQRLQRDRRAAVKHRIADEAGGLEQAVSSELVAVFDPLGIRDFEDFTARRSQLTGLLGRERDAAAVAQRAHAAHLTSASAAQRFDRLADAMIPEFAGSRAERKARANFRAARKRERDGLAAHLHALHLRKSTILGSDDESELEAELGELQRIGVEATHAVGGGRRAIEIERSTSMELLRSARERCALLAGELAGAQAQVPDLAALEEDLARTYGDIARLETFERAVSLAKSTLEARTQEAHQAFARRLEDYAAGALGSITAGRYAEIFIDPMTLTIRVRIPETRLIADLSSVSAGTRDQTYLVVRFAMARMFAEAIETAPLLLDEPFAYWDTARIERCLPIIARNARAGQAILLTASRELADAAERAGAVRVDLSETALIRSNG